MDLSVRSETFQNEDQSWLGSARGTDSAQSITLDVSTFTAGTHYPNGYFPSGTAIARFTGTGGGGVVGLYGPYTGGASDGKQTLAGFLLTSVKAPAVNTTDVSGALLDTGRVIVSKLPAPSDTTVDATAQATNAHFVYVA